MVGCGGDFGFSPALASLLAASLDWAASFAGASVAGVAVGAASFGCCSVCCGVLRGFTSLSEAPAGLAGFFGGSFTVNAAVDREISQPGLRRTARSAACAPGRGSSAGNTYAAGPSLVRSEEHMS